MELEKNDIIECTVDDMGIYGEGITHVGGQTVFIPGAIRGERVSAKVVTAKSTFAHAVLTRILDESPYRVLPPCPYFKQCGGCFLQHLAYEEQLRLKRDIVAGAFKKYAGLDIKADLTVASDSIYGYRNKFSMPVRLDRKSGTVGGLFMRKSHRIVEIENCPLQKERTFIAAAKALRFARDCGLNGYDETAFTGDLRHIIVRSLSDELSLTFVLNREKPNFETALHDGAKRLGKDNVSIYININKAKNNVILGNTSRLIFGGALANVNGMSVETHPLAFFQVNDNIRDKLYAAVKDEIDDGVGVADAYSGAGIMSAILSQKAEHVVGVEISEAAVNSANALKGRLKRDNLSFVCGDCAEMFSVAVTDLKAKGVKKINAVLDPPKSGCDEKVLREISSIQDIDKIIYVSCNPSTLARDAKILMSGGYEVKKVRPFDMFPQTMSVETLVVMERFRIYEN